MVFQVRGKLRVVIAVCFERSETGPVAAIETLLGWERMAGDSQIDVWHAHGEPFLLAVSPEDMDASPPGGDSESGMPAQDAAGTVPVWRGPKRPS